MTWPTKTDFVDGDVLTASQVNNIGTNLNLFDPTSATVGQVPIADGAGSVAFGAAPAGAIKIMTPSAVATSSGTATINADGSVTLAAAKGTSLQGVFDATCENYLVKLVGFYDITGGNDSITFQTGGVDSGGSRRQQWIKASSTSVTTNTGTQNWICEPIGSAVSPTSVDIYVYAPFVAQRTRYYSNSSNDLGTSVVLQVWGQNNDTAGSFDGFRLSTGFAIDGLITVYGYEI